MKDIALVVGHDWSSKGAYSSILGMSEYDFMLAVAKKTCLDWYVHNPHYSYRRKMKNTYSKLAHYDLTIELHFNAAMPSANGVECFYYHTNQEGKEISKKYCDFIADRYNVRNRGAKPLSNRNQRGYYAIASGIPTGILVEPFFGTNPEANKYTIDNYAAALSEFCRLL